MRVQEFQALSVLFRQLAIAERQGVPAHEVAGLLAQDPQWPRRVHRLLEGLARAMRSHSLAASFGTMPDRFAPETAQLLRLAEEHGALPQALEALAEDFRQQAEDARSIHLALAWPLGVGAFIVAVLVTLALFVVPAFDEVYSQFNVEAPAQSSWLVFLASLALRHAWWWAPLLVLLVVAAWQRRLPRWLERPVAAAWGRLGFVRRHATDRFVLRLLRWLRFGDSAGALAPAALAHLRVTTSFAPLAAAASNLEAALQRGASPVAALTEEPTLPRRLALLAQLGQRFGDLGAAYTQMGELAQAEAQESSVHYEQGCLLSLYAVLGVAAIAAVIAVYLPIFQFGTVV
jgi:type II secretory pathway component PulF